jgi:hypothetical protein
MPGGREENQDARHSDRLHLPEKKKILYSGCLSPAKPGAFLQDKPAILTFRI